MDRLPLGLLYGLLIELGCSDVGTVNGPRDAGREAAVIPVGSGSAYSPPAGSSFDIWFIAGQSNAMQTGDKADLPTALQSPQDDILYAKKTFANPTDPTGTEHSWQALAPATNNSFGSEILFGRELADAGHRIAIVKFAIAGSGLAADWLGAPDRYADAVVWWDSQLALFPPPLIYSVRGLLWIQGETDAGSATDSAAYEANMNTLASQFRADYGASTLILVLKLNDECDRTYRDDVRAAEVAYVAGDPDSAIYDTDDIPLQPDNVHLTSAGQIASGERAAALVPAP